MSDAMLDWSGAEDDARAITDAWAAEGGPGGAIVLFDRDGERAALAGGLASLEHHLPFTPDTACRYASVSKHFLASLVIAERAPELHAPLGALLPLSAALATVEVGRALDMTGGLPDAMETLWLLGVPPTAALDRHALLRFVSRFPATNFLPGAEISYSNTGYRLVQAAVEQDGRSYFDALHTRFLAPLSLGICLPEDWSEPVPALASGYWHDGGPWRIGQYGLHISASGGLAGSARDLATWAAALLADRTPVQGLLGRLSAERHLEDGRGTGYGLGIARTEIGGRHFLGHGGSLPGYKTHFLLNPLTATGVALVSNREDTVAARACQRIMGALLGFAMPSPAGEMLHQGLFVTDSGPFWLKIAESSATFLGAQEDLFDLGDGHTTSLSAHLPVRLRNEGEAIAGEIGHVTRRFHRGHPDPMLTEDWSGRWRAKAENMEFEIDGTRMQVGVGPLLQTIDLEPIAADRALTSRSDRGPWKQRACLWMRDGELRLVTNRSRILHFVRQA